MEPRYTPLKDEKKPYDQLIIPPPMPVEDFDDKFLNPPSGGGYNDRIPTASDIRPTPNGPDFSAAPVNHAQTE